MAQSCRVLQLPLLPPLYNPACALPATPLSPLISLPNVAYGVGTPRAAWSSPAGFSLLDFTLVDGLGVTGQLTTRGYLKCRTRGGQAPELQLLFKDGGGRPAAATIHGFDPAYGYALGGGLASCTFELQQSAEYELGVALPFALDNIRVCVAPPGCT